MTPVPLLAITLQSVIGLGEVHELPILGNSADHAVYDTNDEGDLLVVWQSTLPLHGGFTKQSEGLFLERLGPESWRVPPASELLLFGDPSLGVFGPNEACPKPRVASVGEDFVVVWARVDRDTEDARLEAAVVDVTGSSVTLERPAPGVGYVVDPAFDAGSSGNNVDLVRKQVAWEPGAELERVAVAANVHETHASGVEHEYEIRLWRIDARVSPPEIRSLGIPVPSAIVDSPTSYGSGRMPPNLCEEDTGSIVIAYEEFLSAQRTGASTHEGRVQIRRFVGAGPWQLQERGSLTLHGTKFWDHQRRPTLVSSFLDARNIVSLSWTEFDFFGGEGRAHHGSIHVENSGLRWQDLDFPNGPAWPVRSALCVAGADRRFLLASWLDQEDARLVAWVPTLAILFDLALEGLSGIRVFAKVRDEFDGQGVLERRLLPLSFDAVSASLGNHTIHVQILSI